MKTVFISYGRENQDQVRSLAEDIEDLGRMVWFDQELTGGQKWWDQILKKIRECDVFVFALSPESLESQACMREYCYADKLGRTILPVIVAEGVSNNLLPSALQQIEYVDYRRADKEALRALSKALTALPPSGPLPDRLPEPPAVPISYLGGLREQIEASEHLSFEQQTGIVLRLKQRLPEAKDAEDACDLLRRLRSRDDLYAKVGDEIDSLLREETQPPAKQEPVAEKPSPAAIPLTHGARKGERSVNRPVKTEAVLPAASREEKAVRQSQPLVELVPAKTAWLYLLGSMICQIPLIRMTTHYDLEILFQTLWFWNIVLVFAAVLLVAKVVWHKVAPKPMAYRLIFFFAPLSFAIFVGLFVWESYASGILSPFSLLSKTYLSAFVMLLSAAFGLWKEAPAAPVSLTSALFKLAIGLSCAMFVVFSSMYDIIYFLMIIVDAALVVYLLGVSWKGLHAMKPTEV